MQQNKGGDRDVQENAQNDEVIQVACQCFDGGRVHRAEELLCQLGVKERLTRRLIEGDHIAADRPAGDVGGGEHQTKRRDDREHGGERQPAVFVEGDTHREYDDDTRYEHHDRHHGADVLVGDDRLHVERLGYRVEDDRQKDRERRQTARGDRLRQDVLHKRASDGCAAGLQREQEAACTDDCRLEHVHVLNREPHLTLCERDQTEG